MGTRSLQEDQMLLALAVLQEHSHRECHQSPQPNAAKDWEHKLNQDDRMLFDIVYDKKKKYENQKKIIGTMG